ncbi:TWiK family of potassium channels protein 7-like isoform X4 [Sitophilus oryzae]|uniref:TWiK family of potassium channels protein 7-like isoform X3 n=1 Tax=Sitophilus oryzae TaxID=7048 RepID=A0A6J2Y502_SITOR|nr:TWiK family of potassium channels protein 7-like isoform X3 [Sitophilus oryzae]XP_030758879.1 TWiK family of potassium channels protein 7-like isoform X4 [Sitophilus oryzae]
MEEPKDASDGDIKPPSPVLTSKIEKNGPGRPKFRGPKVRRRERKSLGDTVKCTKIIEVLDPQTSHVVARKSIAGTDKLFFLKIFSITHVIATYQLHILQFRKDYGQIKRLIKVCMCELILIMILCGLGGLTFKYVEGNFETFYKCGVKRVKRDFIDLLWTKSHNLREEDWKSLARARLRSFEEELHNAHEAGMTDYSGQRSWSFLNGIVYSLTVITTIGYGHMFPKTHTGRALTIVYALIGIPLFLIALTDFGKLFTRGIKFLWSFVRRLYYTGSCRRVRKTTGVDDIFKGAQMMYDVATFRRPSMFHNPEEQDQDPENQAPPTDTPTTPAISNFEIDDEFNLPISVALFILVAYIFCGACIYMVIENWRFFEAFYFVFISMSTIGFGDYVPRSPAFMIISIIYLVFGLALMSMCFNVVQAKLSDTFKQASAKIGATIGLEVDENGSVITTSPDKPEAPPIPEPVAGSNSKM